MPGRPVRRGHPQEWVARAVAGHGEAAVVTACAALLSGADPADVEIALDDLGGSGSRRYVTGRPSAEYWPRVWGARGLRYAWQEGGEAAAAAEAALLAGLADPHWRVREMCAKVVALHEVGAAGDRLAPLLSDEVPRVRAAAAAALGAVGEHEHLEPVLDARADEDPAVARAAARAADALRRRLDLPSPQGA